MRKIKILKFTLFTAAVFGLGVFAFSLAAFASQYPCNDGIDNDKDGRTDAADYVCLTTNNETEWVPGEMKAVNITRITHSAYDVDSWGKTSRSPWNVDYSRILMYESGIYSNDNYIFHPKFSISFPNSRGNRLFSLLNWNTLPNGEKTTQSGHSPNGVTRWIDGEYKNLRPKDGSAGNLPIDSGSYGSWDYVEQTGLLHVRLSSSEQPNFNLWSTNEEPRKLIWGCIKDSCVTESSGGIGEGISKKLQDFDFENSSNGNYEERVRSLTDWDQNTIELPSYFEYEVFWSPYPGETNIVYALNSYTHFLITYNVDTEQIIPVASYDAGGSCTIQSKICKKSCTDSGGIWTGLDVCNAEIIGFSKDAVSGEFGHQHQIMIDLDYDSGRGSGDAYRIFTDHKPDGSFGTPKYCGASGCSASKVNAPFYGSCDEEMRWSEIQRSIHSASSPDGQYFVWDRRDPTVVMKNDGAGGVQGNCNDYSAGKVRAGVSFWGHKPIGVYDNHPSWLGSNDWYVMGASNSQQNAGEPNIFNETVAQVMFDRSVPYDGKPDNRNTNEAAFIESLLISRPSAGRWDAYQPNSPYCTSSNDCTHYLYKACDSRSNECFNSLNYNALPSPTVSFDAKHLHFQGTNGRYSRDDKGWCALASPNSCDAVGDNWEGFGTYIAGLVPVNSADVNVDGNVNIKDIQICIKAIVAPGSFTTPDQLNQLAKCKAVALPDDVVNIKDIQAIVRAIIGG